MTRPDTVPAALRFEEDSAVYAGLEERTIRQLPPYGGRPEILPPMSDEATVVEKALSQIPVGAQGVSEGTLLKAADPARRSGTRHRLSAPPPEPAPQPDEMRAPQVAALGAPPAARSRGPALVLAVVLGTVPAYFFGKGVGDGSLERAVLGLFGSGAQRAAPVPSTAPAPRVEEPPGPAPTTLPSEAPVTPHAAPAPSPAPAKVPVLRFDALPLAQTKAEETTEKTTMDAGRARPETKKAGVGR